MSDWKNVQYKDGKFKTGEGGGGGSSTFAGLDDVNFSNLQNGQVPKYNSATQKWENANESGGGGTVTDVTLDGNSVVNGQGVAVFTTPNISDLKDANISNPSDGQVLQYSNTSHKWENTTPASGGNIDDVKVNGTSVVDANNVAQITSYKEVTLSEYNALPASKTSDGVLYCIKDVGSADGFPPLIYSDEEREVGVWRDGKPLYQKTIVKTNVAKSTGSNILITKAEINSDLEKICYINGYIGTMPINSSIDGSDGFVQIWGDTDIYYHFNWYETSPTAIITVRYTKTTDTAGSGTWTTQGGYAQHYSTTEHVIGTWIDGKTLYEKTFETTSPSSANTVVSIVDTTDLSIDSVISISGYCLLTSDYFIPLGFYATSTSHVVAYPTKTAIQCNAGSSYTSKPIKVTIQYTKTTD